MLLNFLILFISICGSLVAYCGDNKTACLQQYRHLCLSGSYWSYSSDHFWNSEGKKREAYNEFEKIECQFYAEYGLTSCDTIWIKDGWARINESVNGRTMGFTDIELGWKRYFGQKWGAIISGEAVGLIPIEAEHKPGLRYGRYGGELNLLISKSFICYERMGWFDFRFGYRKYEGFPSDQIRTDLTGNFKLLPCLQLLLAGKLEYGLFNGHSVMNQSFFCFYSNYRLFKGQIELLFTLYKGAAAFAGYQRHFWGRNVGTGGSWYAGAQVQF